MMTEQELQLATIGFRAGYQELLGFGGTCHGPNSLLLCTSVMTR